MEGFEQCRFYREACISERRGDDCIVYKMQCEDGYGQMISYRIFPGIELIFNTFHAGHCQENREKNGILEINYCVSGRFECSFQPGESVILGPGDMSANIFDGKNGETSKGKFPTGYYEGISIFIDCDTAQEWGKQNLGIFSVDFQAIRKRLFTENWFLVRNAGPRCEHIFQELYEGVRTGSKRQLQLKLVELSFCLQEMPLSGEKTCYFPNDQVELVKHLRDHMVSDSSHYSSVAELAREHGISESSLQKIFQAVYGSSVYKYIKDYRLEQAAVSLQKTQLSITEIALESGFSNPGKFSEAFRKKYGCTPGSFRREKKRIDLA